MARPEVVPLDGMFMARLGPLSLGLFKAEDDCQRICDILAVQQALEQGIDPNELDDLHNSVDTYAVGDLALAEILDDVPTEALIVALQGRAAKPIPSLQLPRRADSTFPGYLKDDVFKKPGKRKQPPEEGAHLDANGDEDAQAQAQQHRRHEQHSMKKAWWRTLDAEEERMIAMATTLTQEDCLFKQLKPPRDWYAIFFGFRCIEITATPHADTVQALQLAEEDLQPVHLNPRPSPEDEAGEYIWEATSIFDTLSLQPGDFLMLTAVDEEDTVLGAPPAVALSVIRKNENSSAATVLAESAVSTLLGPLDDGDGEGRDGRGLGTAVGAAEGLRRRTSRSRRNPYGEDFVGGEIYDEAYYASRGGYVKRRRHDDGEMGSDGEMRGAKRAAKRIKKKGAGVDGDPAPRGAPPRPSLGIARVRVSGQRVPATVLQRLHGLNQGEFLIMLTNFYVGLRGGFKLPNFGRQTLNLHTVFWAAMERGGYETVTLQKQWKAVCRATGIDLTGLTSASNCMRTNYERCLLDFENYLCSGQYEVDLAAGLAPLHTQLTDASTTRFFVPPPPPLPATVAAQMPIAAPHAANHIPTSLIPKSLPPRSAEALHCSRSARPWESVSFAPGTNDRDRGMPVSSFMKREILSAEDDGHGVPPTPSALAGSPTEGQGSGTSSAQFAATTTNTNNIKLPSGQTVVAVLRGGGGGEEEDAGKAAPVKVSVIQPRHSVMTSLQEGQAAKLREAKQALREVEQALAEVSQPWAKVEEARRALESNAAWVAELEAGLKEALAFGEALAARYREAETEAEAVLPANPVLQQRLCDLRQEIMSIHNERVMGPPAC